VRECQVIPVNLRLLPLCFFLHTGLRVHRAPGIPHALGGRKRTQSFGRMAPGEREGVSSFRGGSQSRTSDVQLHIGESRDSGFDAGTSSRNDGNNQLPLTLS